MIGLAALVAAPAAAQQDVQSLAGRWTVDLRPSPSAPAYTQPMVLSIGDGGVVTGSFYNSEIEDGLAALSNGRTCFAFRTSDGTAPYQSSGCLVGDRVVGQTWSEGRRFLLAWTADRAR
nr:hypothetical protein [Sphingomonas jejuensis]